MTKQLLMGNQAIALGAIRAGVGLVSGYPGTPSTEILETVAKNNPGDIYVEWSVNEKVALEVAAGAAYAGTRALVTMKQVGLNVASDPLLSLAYVGVKGGLVIAVADDPGPISSQTEQDTRTFAGFAKLPVFDPTSPEEAYTMIGAAFACSEKYRIPVLFRPTTRICHAVAAVDVAPAGPRPIGEGFRKSDKWVIFPRLSYQNHLAMAEWLPRLADEFSRDPSNHVSGSGRYGVAAGGISWAYVQDALTAVTRPEPECRKLFKVATPHPFPEALALQFLAGLDAVLVYEELDPVIEKELLLLCGRHRLPVRIFGKLSGHVTPAGENSTDAAITALRTFLETVEPTAANSTAVEPTPAGAPGPAEAAVCPALPVRPPVLCAGCPHRASFYAVKQAMKTRKAVFSGDIGCYTLGNASPLQMVDTCLCMGAGITIAQGLQHAEPDAVHFAFVGDSTFFHSGITGLINAIYNQTRIVLIVLDNGTTAMTGNQPHPGTGRTMMGQVRDKVSIRKVLEAIGVASIQTVDPMRLDRAAAAVRAAADQPGVAAVIFESPCIAIIPPAPRYTVRADTCTGCKRCIRELGCPAIVMAGDKAAIEASLCYGCGICAQVCPFGAIVQGGDGSC